MSKRIQVMISEEMDKKLTSYSERYGVPKSSIVSFVLGQWIDGVERTNNAVYGITGQDGFLKELFNGLAKEIK